MYYSAHELPPPQRAGGSQSRQIALAIDAHLAEPLPAPKQRRQAHQPAASGPKKKVARGETKGWRSPSPKWRQPAEAEQPKEPHATAEGEKGKG